MPPLTGFLLFDILLPTMSSHCCEAMCYHVSTTCSVHKDRFGCPDALVDYDPEFDEYGIIVHDGGSSVIGIRFCPWCGTELPPSKREAWHAEAEK